MLYNKGDRVRVIKLATGWPFLPRVIGKSVTVVDFSAADKTYELMAKSGWIFWAPEYVLRDDDTAIRPQNWR